MKEVKKTLVGIGNLAQGMRKISSTSEAQAREMGATVEGQWLSDLDGLCDD